MKVLYGDRTYICLKFLFEIFHYILTITTWEQCEQLSLHLANTA
jgi:hypothetical protein